MFSQQEIGHACIRTRFTCALVVFVKKSLPVLALFPLVVLTAMACVLPAILSQVDSKAFPTESASSRLLQILFQDDFSNPTSGWNINSDSEGINGYANGGYRIYVNNANWYLWSTPGFNFTDVIVEVEAVRVAGPEENDFGVICRYKDGSNFYKLVLGSDGYYGVSKVIGGKEQLVGMEKMQLNNDVIKRGVGATNQLRVECVGEHLTLLANGQILADVKDAELTSGDIGLIAGAYDTPGVDILFDNLKVIKP